MTKDPLLSVTGIADFMGRSRQTIHTWIQEGRFPPPSEEYQDRRGLVRLWHKSVIVKWIKEDHCPTCGQARK